MRNGGGGNGDGGGGVGGGSRVAYDGWLVVKVVMGAIWRR